MNYVIDENNNKVEAFNKEEVLSVLAQAIKDGTLNNIVADSAFISKLKCCESGTTISEAFVTQAKYNELVAQGLVKPDTLYNIIDDSTYDDLVTIINELKTNQDTLRAIQESNKQALETRILQLEKKLKNEYTKTSERSTYHDNLPYISLNGNGYQLPLKQGKTIEDVEAIGLSAYLTSQANYFNFNYVKNKTANNGNSYLEAFEAAKGQHANYYKLKIDKNGFMSVDTIITNFGIVTTDIKLDCMTIYYK